MFTKGFTSCLSSLHLLNVGEQGTVTHFRNSDERVIEKLMEMGIIPGSPVTLEQRFPSFVIKAGHTRLTLDEGIASSVYVRVIHSH
ncbi:MAG TPA: ferrous iron transport protein A [Cyanobacteria bacterium UBA12227]|nr:ferrous iron transport protein A [Cyanobacteria bacterium UBA12227]HAX86733.1 ferrous iron transport protein A [Cyanobacteria bacterium UBA11370]HBY77264.1 ferrous iron transport protein A [Cyanobacteria bacterium UBA11148]